MSSALLYTHDPRTGHPQGGYPLSDAANVGRVAQQSAAAWDTHWRHTTTVQRAGALQAVAAAMRQQQQAFAQAEAADTGKPLAVAWQEVDGAIALWEYAAALALTRQGENHTQARAGGMALTLDEPIGPVALIVPWNYPLITVAERLPFALAAGCSVVVKPSELAVGALPLLAELLASLLPEHTVQFVYGQGPEVGEALVSHPAIRMVAFVGSTRVGRIIEQAAALHGKRFAGELGGNNYVLVAADADIAVAARAIAAGLLRNGGQACIAGNRVLVDPAVADALLASLPQAMAEHLAANPLQPMITLAHRQQLAAYVDQAESAGWQRVPVSQVPGDGQFFGPVLLDGCHPDSPLFHQEIFGPVLTIARVPQAQFVSALQQSEHGLALYVWSANLTQAMQLARQVRVGRIWINADPTQWVGGLPVGGFGASGLGRECGLQGLSAYCVPKSVLIG